MYHSKKSIVSVRAVLLVRNKTHTNILATRWRCIDVVCAPFHAVIQGQAVVVSTVYRASQFLDGGYGRLGRAGRRYVYWHFDVFGTLVATQRRIKKRVKTRGRKVGRTSPSSLTPS